MRMEETMLVITHPTGISFDLTLDETLVLADFIAVYRQTLLTLQSHTDPLLERILISENDKRDTEFQQ